MTNNGFVGAEAFRKPSPRRYDEFAVDGFGKVRIRNLTERELSGYEASVLTEKGKVSKAKLESARRRLIILCVVDAEGATLLTQDDLPAFDALDGAVTDAIFKRCEKHCGLDGEVEQLVKNSETIHADASPSA